MSYPGHTTEEIARRGKELYTREIRKKVEPRHVGRFIVVDVESGDYEVADDDLEACEHLLARRPGALLYGQPVGTPGRVTARIGTLYEATGIERV